MKTIHFAYHHANFAWGEVLEGWFIDNIGNVMSYELLGSQIQKWKNVDADGYIEKNDLEHNYHLAQKQIAVIPQEELSKRIADSKTLVLHSDFSKPIGEGFDAGEFLFVSYWWDSTRDKYKQILILRKGDTRQENRNPKAVELAKWMETINKQAIKQ